MSLDATLWAWEQKGLTPAEKNVLLSLADRAGEDHTAWPSARRLAQDTELSDRHVRRVLKELVSKGKICRYGEHFSGVIIYQLVGVRGREKDETSPLTKCQGGMTQRQGGADMVSPKPSIEPSRESKPLLNPPQQITQAGVEQAVKKFPGRNPFPECVAITQACRDEADERFRGYSIEFLMEEWLEAVQRRGEILRNPDKAFLAWAAVYAKNHPLPYGGGF